MAIKKPNKTTKVVKKSNKKSNVKKPVKKPNVKKSVEDKNMAVAKALAESALKEVSKKPYKPTEVAKPAQTKESVQENIGSNGKLSPDDVRRLRSQNQPAPLVPPGVKVSTDVEFPPVGSKLSPDDVRKLRELNAPKIPGRSHFVSS